MPPPSGAKGKKGKGSLKLPDTSRQLAAEVLGTMLLLATVVGSGIMAERLAGGNVAIALLGNTIPTGAILVVLITGLGPVSGAHFNPAVSLVFWLRGELENIHFAGFVAVQIAGGFIGVLLAHGMFDETVVQTSQKIRFGPGQWVSEIVATFGLIGAYATEPDADPVAEWLDSCTALQPFARDDHLVLPGHKLPFTGLPTRMRQLIENHHSALERLEDFISTPRTAPECFSLLFKRKISDGTYGLALVESVAHLNHLLHAGIATRARDDRGAWVWTLARQG